MRGAWRSRTGDSSADRPGGNIKAAAFRSRRPHRRADRSSDRQFSLRRYLVTGTDTDVGKTRVAAALALALQNAGRTPTFVKLAQTGTAPGESADAARVTRLTGCPNL